MSEPRFWSSISNSPEVLDLLYKIPYAVSIMCLLCSLLAVLFYLINYQNDFMTENTPEPIGKLLSERFSLREPIDRRAGKEYRTPTFKRSNSRATAKSVKRREEELKSRFEDEFDDSDGEYEYQN